MSATDALPLHVPRYPQHFTTEDSTDPRLSWPQGGPEAWGERCCGIACIRMLLHYYGRHVPSQYQLLWEGLENYAYTERGWLHQGLVEMATRRELEGWAVGTHDRDSLHALASNGVPSIVSCTYMFPNDGRRGGHLVVFTGEFSTSNGWRASFVDPSRWGAYNHSVPASRFWASWTGRAIIITNTGSLGCTLK